MIKSEPTLAKAIGRLTAVLTLLLAATGSARAANLISNGGFEDPGAGWKFGGGWDGGHYTAHDSDDAHSGNHALDIRCIKRGRGGVASTPFKLKPGTILQVSFWLKARGAEGGSILLNYEGTPGDGWNRLEIRGGTFDWKKVTHRCIVPVRHSKLESQTPNK